MEESCICCVCGSEFNKEELKHIEVKGNVKDICKECVVTIKGLI